MSSSVADAYTSVAELYTEMFVDELSRDTQFIRWLQKFAQFAATQNLPVVDLGCRPGNAVHHLSELGLDVFGVDLSVGMIEQARRSFSDLVFALGDMRSLGVADGALGGIVSRHSVIHTKPAELDELFDEWHRVLHGGAPLFMSFFGSRTPDAHGTPFDHKGETAFELDPETVGQLLEQSGFVEVEIEAVPISKGGRLFDHTTILACASTTGGVTEACGTRTRQRS